MQLFNVNSNLFQNTLLGEYEDYKEKLRKNNDASEEVQNFVNGDMLFSINQDSQSLTNLINNSAWNVTTLNNDRADSWKDGTDWLNAITEEIIKVDEPHSFKEAIALIDELSGLMGDTLAGVLLVHDGMIINPLHPLSALILMDNYRAISYTKFKVIVYKYHDRDSMKERYRSDEVDLERVTENVRNIISLYSKKQKINKTLKSVKVNSIGNAPLSNIARLYRVSMPLDAEYDSDLIIIPTTLITRGIAAPYYGTSVVSREDSDAKGTFLTPFQSANITSVVHSTLHRPDFNSVCTGQKDKTTMEGLRTLNHANLSSPLNSSCIGIGALEYADECIKQSLNLYKLGNFVGETLEDELDEQSLQWEREDAESEIRNVDMLVPEDNDEFSAWLDDALGNPQTVRAHDDAVDTLTYQHLVDAQEQLRGNRHLGHVIRIPDGTEYRINGTVTRANPWATTATTTTTTTTGWNPNVTLASDIRPDDIEIGEIHNVRFIEGEINEQETRNRFGETVQQYADQITETAIQGQFTEQERFFPAFEQFTAEAEEDEQYREAPEATTEQEPEDNGDGEEATTTEDI